MVLSQYSHKFLVSCTVLRISLYHHNSSKSQCIIKISSNLIANTSILAVWFYSHNIQLISLYSTQHAQSISCNHHNILPSLYLHSIFKISLYSHNLLTCQCTLKLSSHSACILMLTSQYLISSSQYPHNLIVTSQFPYNPLLISKYSHNMSLHPKNTFIFSLFAHSDITLSHFLLTTSSQSHGILRISSQFQYSFIIFSQHLIAS